MAQRFLFALLLFAIAPIGAAEPPPCIHQLRIYKLVDANQARFHERFRDHALRIMKRHEFRVLATFATRDGASPELVYLLEWPDRETMKKRWAKFLEDPEWIEIKRVTAKAHGALVENIEERTLELTDYSPASIRCGG